MQDQTVQQAAAEDRTFSPSQENTATSAIDCAKCKGTGLVVIPGIGFEYCDCPNGPARRQRNEDRNRQEAEERRQQEERLAALKAKAEQSVAEANRLAEERRAQFECERQEREREQAETRAKEQADSRASAAQVPERFSDAKMEDFGDKTSEVRQAVNAWAMRGALYIWGDVGSGKTHLAAAIMNRLVERGHWCRFIVTTELLLRIQESFGQPAGKVRGGWRSKWGTWDEEPDEDADYDDAAHLWASALDAPVIALDDIATEYTTDWARARLFLLINKRYNDRAAVIVTSNLSPEALAERIGDRTVSRLMHGATVIHLTGQDRRLGDAPGG